MRFLRLAVFVVVAAVIADSTVLGQRQGGPPGGRQGGGAAAGRPGGPGRQGAPDANGGRGGRGQGDARRDPARGLPTGTASIRGRVVSATTGTPVRRATLTITLVNQDNSRSQGGRSVQTDDNGAFEFRNLASGRWTVRASKTGFLEQQFGQRTAFAGTDPIVLGEGQQFIADFRLARGGAITGRVVDEFGDPVAGANVSALRLQNAAQGIRTTRTGTSVPTDDTGAYRIYGLPPGQYYVSVNDPAGRVVMMLSDVVNGAEGTVIRAESFSSITAPDGSPGAFLAEAAARESVRYAPTYYPGTANLGDAQRITLGISEEQSGINLAIVPVRAARITGRVTNSSGAPAQASISLVSQFGQSFNTSGGRNGSGSDGAFTLNNIPPGNYRLNALGPSVGAAPPEVASMPVVVDGNDISGLSLTLGSGGSVQGTVAADNGSRLPQAKIRVTAEPLERGPATLSAGSTVSETGSFELNGLMGVYTLRFESIPSGWTIKSVTANGVDVSDAAMEFRPLDRVSIRVELTDRVTQVSGTVRSDRQIRGTTVVIFPDDPSRWASTSRFVKTTRLNENGQFSVAGLPPHSRYLAVAVDYIEPGETQNVEFLQKARATATVNFSLTPGEQRVLEVPLTVR